MTAQGAEHNVRVTIPPPILCTDNGAMIAAVGSFYFIQGRKDELDLTVNPRATLKTAS